ncbi:MAG: type II toxin-antitoxin system VapC family toxin [Betaproteobacteria bacterium]|nr:type II toxin-antitoxin system VapC family toxin [Betaproteobacteria bacterium]
MKRYLLDTHLVYWWMTADARLGKATRRIIARHEMVVSSASVWEMVLKNASGRLPLPRGSLIDSLEADGFVLLPILPRHVEAVRGLNFPHPDPFDRLLVAQAVDERLTLLTRDAAILALGLDCVTEG